MLKPLKVSVIPSEYIIDNAIVANPTISQELLKIIVNYNAMVEALKEIAAAPDDRYDIDYLYSECRKIASAALKEENS